MRKKDFFSLAVLEQLILIVFFIAFFVRVPSRLSLTDGIKIIVTINTIVLLSRIVFFLSKKYDKYGKVVVHSVKIIMSLLIAATSMLILILLVEEPIEGRTFILVVFLLVSYVYFSDLLIKLHIKFDEEWEEKVSEYERVTPEDDEAKTPTMEDYFRSVDESSARVTLLLLERLAEVKKTKSEINDRYPFQDLEIRMEALDREEMLIQKLLECIETTVNEFKDEISSYEIFKATED